MRHVALTAAIFTGAFFLAPGGSAASAAHLSTDIPKINTAIQNTAALTALHTETLHTTKSVAHDTDASDKSKTPKATTAAAVKNSPAPAKTIAVADGDSLTKIADGNATTYQRLYYANTDITNPDLIFPGQQLRVPAANEELTARPLPENAPAVVRQEVQAESSARSAPAPRASASVSNAPTVASGSVWDSLAMCESGGNWAISTGNGFYGGLQFTTSSWAAVGGSGMPNEASREEQIMRAEMLQARQGWGAWPACTAKLGIY